MKSNITRIYLDSIEKLLLININNGNFSMPRNITTNQYHHALSTLQEKGLIQFKSNYDQIEDAKTTIKGRAYIDSNPKLKNPIDWKWIVTTILMAITAIATTLALFIACNMK